MKVPFISPQLQATKFNYEPKSVLDLRRSPSPSPPADRPAPATLQSYSDVVDLQAEHVLMNHFEDWDSLVRELGLHDDSQSAPPISKSNTPQFTTHCIVLDPPALLPDLPPFDPTHFARSSDFSPLHFANDPTLLNQYNHVFDFVDELIQLAECFETNSPQLAHSILARLSHRLPSPTGKPLQRAAFYFKEALQSLLTGSSRPSTSSEIVQTIKAYKTFSNVSPIPLFSNFTANQAILEAVDGSVIVHVIDFDIGLGGQWASFMREIADKADIRRANPPAIRITAVVPEEYAMESRLMRENLCQFARELNIQFEIQFVSIRTFEFLSFKAIKIADGEKVAVLLTPTIFHRIGAGFVNDLRRVSPHVIVHVDFEGLITPSFRQTVRDGLEFYSTILESLEAANVGGGSGEWIRKIEMFVLLPKIIAAIEAAGRRATPWREVFTGTGIRPVEFSQFADFQADCLLRRVQVRGFHVAKQQAELVLCWQDRALLATSAWRC